MTLHDIIAIVAGWAIPALLTWTISKTGWFTQRPYMLASFIAAAVAIGASYSIITLLTPLKGTIAFAPEAGKCPDGYADRGSFILIRWKTAPEPFQNPGDIPGRGNYQGNSDWVNDHAKLCVHE